MKILVTSGSTQMPIDKVRCLTNIFKGKTGTVIALQAALDGHEVTLIANQSIDKLRYMHPDVLFGKLCFKTIPYNTFDELEQIMKKEITTGIYDVVIHSAAVSDYQVTIVTSEIKDLEWWERQPYGTFVERESKIPSGKITYLGLEPTKKLVDEIRKSWDFKGKLVKFKLQVDMSDEELLEIAKKSRATSDADFIVANCLEWSKSRAYIVDRNDNVESVDRSSLAKRLICEVSK